MIDTEEEIRPLDNPHWIQVLHNVYEDIPPMLLVLQDLSLTCLLQYELLKFFT